MVEFDYSQRKSTREWDTGHEDLYGPRCIKHPGEPKDNCKRCAGDKIHLKHFSKGKKKPTHDQKRVERVARIMEKRKGK